jgi:hypothetical protein
MTKEYRVFDPMTGEHVKASTPEQAQVALEQAVERLIAAQNFSVCEVEIDPETKDETWRQFDASTAVKVAPGSIKLQDRRPEIEIELPYGPPAEEETK